MDETTQQGHEHLCTGAHKGWPIYHLHGSESSISRTWKTHRYQVSLYLWTSQQQRDSTEILSNWEHGGRHPHHRTESGKVHQVETCGLRQQPACNWEGVLVLECDSHVKLFVQCVCMCHQLSVCVHGLLVLKASVSSCIINKYFCYSAGHSFSLSEVICSLTCVYCVEQKLILLSSLATCTTLL